MLFWLSLLASVTLFLLASHAIPVAGSLSTDGQCVPGQSCNMEEEIQGIDELVNFVGGHGGDTSGIRFGIGPEGGGAFASRDIKAGELLFRIPRSAIIAPHLFSKVSALKSPECQVILDHPDTNVPTAFLLFIESAKSHSEFQSYLSILSRDMPINIYSLTDEEIKHCPDIDGIETEVMLARHLVAESYQNAIKCIDSVQGKLQGRGVDFTKLTKERLQWSFAIVLSRAYGIRFADGKGGRSLIPLYDMVNHQTCEKVFISKWEIKKSHVSMIASRAYSKGEQIYECYSRKGNHELFQAFGFTLPDCTVHDEVTTFVPFGEERYAFQIGFESLNASVVLETWKNTMVSLEEGGKPTYRFREFMSLLLTAVRDRLQLSQNAVIVMKENENTALSLNNQGGGDHRLLQIQKSGKVVQSCNMQILTKAEKILLANIPKVEKMYERCRCTEEQDFIAFDDCNVVCGTL